MGIDTDITMVIPALGFLLGHLLFLYPLLRRFDITTTGLILPAIPMGMTVMTEFGFRGIGNIELARTVAEEFGFPATGNGDRTSRKI
jgi:hypothetical protein